MKRTKLQPPYDVEGRTNFPARNLPGVYLIYRIQRNGFGGERRTLRYVGYSASDVYKAMYRHFQVWNDRQADRGERSERVVYQVRKDVRVRVIYCNTGRQAMELEKALILMHKPVDNPDKLELYEITDAGKAMAAEAFTAELVQDNDVPF